MPLYIVRQDITKMKVDAIVNAANNTLRGGGGVDGAIHRAAGRGLLLECMTLGGCRTGDAKITKGYDLPAKYVIHTVGPVWNGGGNGERELLISCYEKSLSLALQNGCESIAFPLISSGVYGYPKDRALKVAVDVISDFLLRNEMSVYIVIFDRAAYNIGEKLFSDIKEYIDDNYVTEQTEAYGERRRSQELFPMANFSVMADAVSEQKTAKPKEEKTRKKTLLSVIKDKAVGGSKVREDVLSEERSLDDIVLDLDESFSEMLLRKIDERGMTDSECYKKANIDRKLFSKIRADKHYKPSKQTVIAFAIALELSLPETEDMLKKAGFALSHSNKFDIIIEYFIKKENYNIFEINEALFAFDQNLLGA